MGGNATGRVGCLSVKRESCILLVTTQYRILFISTFSFTPIPYPHSHYHPSYTFFSMYEYCCFMSTVFLTYVNGVTSNSFSFHSELCFYDSSTCQVHCFCYILLHRVHPRLPTTPLHSTSNSQTLQIYVPLHTRLKICGRWGEIWTGME